MSSTDVAGDYEISTDPARLDIGAMHAYLTRSYWSPAIPFATVRLNSSQSRVLHAMCNRFHQETDSIRR